MEPEEHGGQWWLPGRRENAVPGVLRISPTGQCHLTLIGELRSMWEAGTPSAPNPDTGEVSVT